MFGTSDARQRRYWAASPSYRDVHHPVVRVFARQRVDYLASWLDFESIRTAIDVGCGDGFSTEYMQDRLRRVWGADRSGVMLARHPLRRSGRLTCADVMCLPFADSAVDLVYCWEVLHHLSDPERAVREMARVATRYVLITEPNRLNPLQLMHALADREHRWVLKYSLEYMRKLMCAAGLELAHASSGGFILPNKTPTWLVGVLRLLRYESRFGISNWVLGVKEVSRPR